MSHSIPQRLYLFDLAYAEVPLGNGNFLSMVCAAYLIQMSDGKNILIDTGLPKGSESPVPYSNEKNVLKHLTDLGLAPDDIDIVISSHFDVDHSGYHDAFPKAEFIVQRKHYELALKGHPRFEPSRKHWNHPDLRYRFVEGDTELFTGLHLIETDGHCFGHQSVLVKLPKTGAILLAIDAVVMERLFTVNRKAWPTDDNEAQLVASTQKLLDIVEREHVQLVVFGHDGQRWRSLKTSPQYYE